METEKDLQVREILALLIFVLATGPATEDRLKPLTDKLGFDWDVLGNWARRSGTGPLGQRGIIKK